MKAARPSSNGAERFAGAFSPENLNDEAAVTGVYQAGLDALAEKFGRRA